MWWSIYHLSLLLGGNIRLQFGYNTTAYQFFNFCIVCSTHCLDVSLYSCSLAILPLGLLGKMAYPFSSTRIWHTGTVSKGLTDPPLTLLPPFHFFMVECQLATVFQHASEAQQIGGCRRHSCSSSCDSRVFAVSCSVQPLQLSPLVIQSAQVLQGL